MEKFVRALSPGSPHLEFINTRGELAKNFKISLGQKSTLKTTLNAIVEKISEMNEKRKETSRITDSSRKRVLAVVDLDNIQAVWDQKLKNALEKNHVNLYEHFPVVKSQAESFPYKFWIKCPSCKNEQILSITLDVRSNGSISQPHYRFSHFVQHVIKCVKE